MGCDTAKFFVYLHSENTKHHDAAIIPASNI